jgi:phosphatidylglycerol:prolipoprotein diacylglycerol transferase
MLAYYLHDLQPFIFRLWDNVGPRWYGLAYVLAFLCSYFLFSWLAKCGYADLGTVRNQKRLDVISSIAHRRIERMAVSSQVADFITGCALFGVILGGRLGYVLFYKPEMLRDPISILRVWEGGMSSHGGMLGIFFFALFYARRHHLSWRNLGDNLVVTAPIGLFFGRCANFINGELYGRAANFPWAVQFPKELLDNSAAAERAISACAKIDPSLTTPEAIVAAVHRQPQVKEILRTILTPRHPSQLYEAFFEGIVLFVILWIVRTRTRAPNGLLIGLFFICYAIFRIVVENFREPDATLIAGFTRGQFLSFFLIAIGIAFIVAAKMKPTFPKRMTNAECRRNDEAPTN